jgi:hypothetical protein
MASCCLCSRRRPTRLRPSPKTGSTRIAWAWTTSAGTFQVAYRAGFVPAVQDSYEVMRFVNRSGNFNTFAGLFIGNTQVVTVIVNPNNVLINGLEGPELADTLYLPVIIKP